MGDINYIDSNNVELFPAGYRQGYPKSKFTSEENLTWMNRLSSNKDNNNQSFMDPTDISKTKLIIVIQGYHFRIPVSDSKEERKAKLGKYAFIKLKTLDNIGGLILQNIDNSNTFELDNGGVFEGLGFTNELTEAGDYYVQILDNEGNLLAQNLKLNASEIREDKTEKNITEEFSTKTAKVENLVNKNANITALNIANDEGVFTVADKKIFITNTKNYTDGAQKEYIKVDAPVVVNGIVGINTYFNVDYSNEQSIIELGGRDTPDSITLDGSIYLPKNVDSSGDYLWVQSLRYLDDDTSEITNNWIAVDEENSKGSIVKRNDNGDIYAADIYTSSSGYINNVNITTIDTETENSFLLKNKKTNNAAAASIKVSGKAEFTENGILVGAKGCDEDKSEISITKKLNIIGGENNKATIVAAEGTINLPTNNAVAGTGFFAQTYNAEDKTISSYWAFLNATDISKDTFDTTDRLYPVKIDENKKVYVCVPWTDTHNDHVIVSGENTKGKDIKGLASSDEITLGDSGVTAASYGDSADQTPGYGSTFKVPYITVNSKGIVTGLSNHTVTIPKSDDTNQLVKVGDVTFGEDDTVEFYAGDNVIITGDSQNKKITIASHTYTLSELGGVANDDTRLSDTRTPKPHTHSKDDVGLTDVQNLNTELTIKNFGNLHISNDITGDTERLKAAIIAMLQQMITNDGESHNCKLFVASWGDSTWGGGNLFGQWENPYDAENSAYIYTKGTCYECWKNDNTFYVENSMLTLDTASNTLTIKL